MSKIYEVDISLFDKVKKINSYDCFIFFNKFTGNVVAVDNTQGEFFTENFSNKLKGLIYLTNNSFLPKDVEKEYSNNFDNYTDEKYEKIVSDSCDYYIDRKLDDKDFLKFKLNKKYVFKVYTALSGETEFESTIKEALGLAINYESDLTYKDVTLISPMCFDWEKNSKLIEKYVGREYLAKAYNNFGWSLPECEFNDECIKIINRKNKEIKL